MLRGRLSMRAGGRPIPKGAVSRLSTGNGLMLQKMTAGRAERGCASRNARAEEERLGQDDVGGMGRKGSHQRLVLGLGGSGYDVLDVEGDRLDALQSGALGKALEDRPVVEVGCGGQRYIRCTRGADPVGEARTGDEAHVVTAVDEALGDRQQRCDMTVERRADDDDG